MTNITLTEDQSNLLNTLESGANVLVAGAAGSGKTFVVKRFIAQERGKDKRVIVCAPTGLAARNIGGETIHRAFKVPTYALDPNKEVPDPPTWIESADIIVIDEVSMVRLDLFDYVSSVIKAAEAKSGRHKQVVLVGDFYQLPPVILHRECTALHHWYGGRKNVNAGYSFLAKCWNSFEFKFVNLQTVVRQADAKFSKALTQLRGGSIKGYHWIVDHQSPDAFVDAPWLCPTKRLALQINTDKLNQLEGEVKTYVGHRHGIVSEEDMPADEVVKLKVGARVMVLANDPSNQYKNGSLGTVLELKDKSVVVKLDSVPEGMSDTAELGPFVWLVNGYAKVCGEVEASAAGEINVDYDYEPLVIGKYTQIPVKLAYAMTIHKSQGQTFSFPVNVDVNVFCRGQLYTALSRVTKVENIHLEGDPKSCYKADPDVKKFFKVLQRKAT